ncbi:unnamed protein product [Amoebophrya sp. A120]|nr:unnamed protein product [Amoebophrya sp. A120]|eukprot:GSA120T00002061001.1
MLFFVAVLVQPFVVVWAIEGRFMGRHSDSLPLSQQSVEAEDELEQVGAVASSGDLGNHAPCSLSLTDNFSDEEASNASGEGDGGTTDPSLPLDFLPFHQEGAVAEQEQDNSGARRASSAEADERSGTRFAPVEVVQDERDEQSSDVVLPLLQPRDHGFPPEEDHDEGLLPTARTASAAEVATLPLSEPFTTTSTSPEHHHQAPAEHGARAAVGGGQQEAPRGTQTISSRVAAFARGVAENDHVVSPRPEGPPGSAMVLPFVVTPQTSSDSSFEAQPPHADPTTLQVVDDDNGVQICEIRQVSSELTVADVYTLLVTEIELLNDPLVNLALYSEDVHESIVPEQDVAEQPQQGNNTSQPSRRRLSDPEERVLGTVRRLRVRLTNVDADDFVNHVRNFAVILPADEAPLLRDCVTLPSRRFEGEGGNRSGTLYQLDTVAQVEEYLRRQWMSASESQQRAFIQATELYSEYSANLIAWQGGT